VKSKYRISGDAMTAEDMVQELFLRLLSQSQPLLEASLHGMVYTSLRHLLNDYYRRRAHQTDYEQQLLYGEPSAPVSADMRVAVRDITEAVEHGLLRVADNCRTLYRLHIYDGMKTAEIAELTGQSYKSVEYSLGLARREVRRSLRRTI
jgi:RNA polymerase sigma-70 factor (ECF subfamily)